MMVCFGKRSTVVLGLLVGVFWWTELAMHAAEASACVNTGIYIRAESLQETLLATRERYHQWLKQQPGERKLTTLGQWHATPPISMPQADTLVRPADGFHSDQQLTAGRPLWSPQETLVDGKAVKFLEGTGESVAFLTRAIQAKRDVVLTIGIGGGDELRIWLNGKMIGVADTHLTHGRYGCSYRVDGTRVDQMLIDLPLEQGENELIVRMVIGDEPTFYFSDSPRPVSRLWEQIRHDFPSAENPLLELAHADWFAVEGWLAARDTHLELALLDRLTANAKTPDHSLSTLGSTSADGPSGPAAFFDAASCGESGAMIRAESLRLEQENAQRVDRRWLDLCVKASVLAKLRTELARLRAAVRELGSAHGPVYPMAELLVRLEEYQERLSERAKAELDPVDGPTRRLMAEMPAMKREMLVDLNPMLRDAEIIFVKRHTYNSKHYYDDFLHISRFGGNLSVLSLADGGVRDLAPSLSDGIFDRYDLSFDAKQVAFGYRRPKREGFRIYEVAIDGSGLRQVTHPPADEEQRIAKYGRTSQADSWYGSMAYQFWTDDLHPCYLPNGRICFSSTRCEHGVLCTPAHYLACSNLFRMEADGTNIRPLSHGALSEFTPTMLEDGRILFNRWEYIYKGIAAVQPLWLMRPDGSGNEEFYGDNITNPGVFWQARQIPGQPRMAVCTGCGHEPLGVGQILLLDLNKSKRTPEAIISLTPEVRTEGIRGLYQYRNGQWKEDIYGPFHADPYPLSDKFFLVSCNSAGRYNDETAYAIYLIDTFGNRVLVHDEPDTSCWQPMLLRPRTTPPVLPEVNRFAAEAEGEPAGEATATIFLNDVYRGLEGVERGTVKYLRVMEQIPKPWAAEIDPLRGEDRVADGFGGHLVVSMNAHIWIAVLRGIVPVEEDGSAYFEVPAERNLFFQALDEDFMEVQRMRTFINLMPGESRSCIGCHEHRTQAPESRIAMALGRTPSELLAQPGEIAPRPLHYPSDVQPIWNRHCVDCHNGQDSSTEPDLRGEMTKFFNRSYESIFDAELVDTIREWAGSTYSMENAARVGPYSHGSHRSRLVELLKAGHYDVTLSREEWIKFVTWIDCGAPYYGSYFGRRNLAYRGRPDFRPLPTLQSACGIAPDLPKADLLRTGR